ncbi:histidinol-phosphate transaminase [Algoriphagus namhaensis]
MGFDLTKLLRPHILTLSPYTSARDEYTGREGVFLDANENPHGSITDENFSRYPDPYQKELKSELGKIKNIPADQIFLGNGSDEAIDLLFRAFCNPGKDNVILLPPTYGMYGVSAAINEVEIRNVSLTEDFQLRPKEILEAADEHTKILFICSPNNPSGNCMKEADMLFLLENFKGLVVIDEAYVDFMTMPSFITKLTEYKNLLVIQTFSKAWGLASLRLGMAFGSTELIGVLNKIKPPYNISGLTQSTVLEAIGRQEKVKKMVNQILNDREKLAESLERIPEIEKVYPSDANFLLVKIDRADEIYQGLIDRKIILRNRSRVTLCENCLRITVGTEDENRQFLTELKNWLKSN